MQKDVRWYAERIWNLRHVNSSCSPLLAQMSDFRKKTLISAWTKYRPLSLFLLSNHGGRFDSCWQLVQSYFLYLQSTGIPKWRNNFSWESFLIKRLHRSSSLYTEVSTNYELKPFIYLTYRGWLWQGQGKVSQYHPNSRHGLIMLVDSTKISVWHTLHFLLLAQMSDLRKKTLISA